MNNLFLLLFVSSRFVVFHMTDTYCTLGLFNHTFDLTEMRLPRFASTFLFIHSGAGWGYFIH
jgi:hypothetical protein